LVIGVGELRILVALDDEADVGKFHSAKHDVASQRQTKPCALLVARRYFASSPSITAN
jgi:hypothetical protein